MVNRPISTAFGTFAPSSVDFAVIGSLMVSLRVAPLLWLSEADFGFFSRLFLVFAFAISALINRVDNK